MLVIINSLSSYFTFTYIELVPTFLTFYLIQSLVLQYYLRNLGFIDYFRLSYRVLLYKVRLFINSLVYYFLSLQSYNSNSSFIVIILSYIFQASIYLVLIFIELLVDFLTSNYLIYQYSSVIFYNIRSLYSLQNKLIGCVIQQSSFFL